MELPPLLVTRPRSIPTQPPFEDSRNAHNKHPKKGTLKETVASNNLEEKNLNPYKSSSDAGRKSSKSAKHKSKSSSKGKAVKMLEVDAQNVPAPAPDTGLTSAQPLAIRTGILPVIPSQMPTTLTIPSHTLGSSFSLLPHLTAFVTSTAISATLVPTGTPNDTSRALGANQPDQTESKGPTHLQIIVAVLVSVSLACLLLCGFVFWRWHNRPRKRTCPTPSLPIFQDPFADQDLKVDEESLFGGHDCSSAVARPNSNGIYPWIQYTPQPSDGLATMRATSPVPALPSTASFAPPPTALVSERPKQPAAHVHAHLPIGNAPSNPPMQQMQSALSRAASRVSALSMSIYPNSPQSNSGIGLAIGGASPLTADGTPVLERKPSRDRLSKSIRQSYRHSLAATEYLDIYGGAQVISPVAPPPVAAAPSKYAMRKSAYIPPQGRAPVKAGYTAGTVNAAIRASSTVTGATSLARAGNRASMSIPPDNVPFVIPSLSPALKSDARRERDTRALTSALGLASPSPQDKHSYLRSPATTLHPDDSITLAGDRQRTKSSSAYGRSAHNRAQSEAMSPGMEASARLGNLMLAEFTSMGSFPSARAVANAQGHGSGSGGGGNKARVVSRKNVNAGTGSSSRSDDRPPRVPSPPPLPSLAQMAMAHANAEEYEDYRSPTYSIYGLYEADRKSRMQGGNEGF